MAYSKTANRAYWRSTWTVIDWIILISMRWLSNFNEHIGVNSVNYFILNYTVIVKWVRPAGLIKHTFHVSHRSAYPLYSLYYNWNFKFLDWTDRHSRYLLWIITTTNIWLIWILEFLFDSELQKQKRWIRNGSPLQSYLVRIKLIECRLSYYLFVRVFSESKNRDPIYNNVAHFLIHVKCLSGDEHLHKHPRKWKSGFSLWVA